MPGRAQSVLAVNRPLVMIFSTGLMTIPSLNFTWKKFHFFKGRGLWDLTKRKGWRCAYLLNKKLLLLFLLFPRGQQVGTDQAQSIRQIWGRRILRTNPKFRSISAVQTNSISTSSKQLKGGVKSTCLLETYVHDCKLVCIWGKDSESSPIPGHFTYFISSWLPSVTGL